MPVVCGGEPASWTKCKRLPTHRAAFRGDSVRIACSARSKNGAYVFRTCGCMCETCRGLEGNSR
jgi:hypothetical protein